MMEKLRAPVATMALGFLLMVLGLALTHSLWSIDPLRWAAGMAARQTGASA